MAKFIEITNEDGSKDYLPGDPDTMMDLYGTNIFFPPKNGKKLYKKTEAQPIGVIQMRRQTKIEGRVADAATYMNRHINDVVAYAVSKSKSSSQARNQLISETVGHFVHSQLSSLYQSDTLHKPFVDNASGRIDINIMLETFGTTGTRIGALAYVVATRLEALLPVDDVVVQDIRTLVKHDNGTYETLKVDPATQDIKISECYTQYIMRDPFVFKHFLETKENRKENRN